MWLNVSLPQSLQKYRNIKKGQHVQLISFFSSDFEKQISTEKNDLNQLPPKAF